MPTAKTAPTLNDVARLAGVSTATVSRCLNEPDKVVEETRMKVNAAINTLGYTPNFAARVMAARRTNTIGAIVPTLGNAIFALGLQAFQEELARLGYTLLVSSNAYSREVEQAQIRSLVARGADGLFLIGGSRERSVYEYLTMQTVPAVVAWSYAPDLPVPSIGFDNHGAMMELTEKVISLGHRRLAMISGLTEGNDRATQRLSGFRAAIEKHGLPPDQIVVETRYGISQGQEAFAKVIDSPTPPTAVICGNDVLAAGALKLARERGIRVPEDVSIAGFDNIEIADIVSPTLTTVEVPHREMGIAAARQIVEMVEGRSGEGSLCLPTRILWRESLAAPLA